MCPQEGVSYHPEMTSAGRGANERQHREGLVTT